MNRRGFLGRLAAAFVAWRTSKTVRSEPAPAKLPPDAIGVALNDAGPGETVFVRMGPLDITSWDSGGYREYVTFKSPNDTP